MGLLTKFSDLVSRSTGLVLLLSAVLVALAAGRLLDIQLLDHLVIGHDAYASLRDRGVAFDRPGIATLAAD